MNIFICGHKYAECYSIQIYDMCYVILFLNTGEYSQHSQRVCLLSLMRCICFGLLMSKTCLWMGGVYVDHSGCLWIASDWSNI